jgi:hypothetical protein
MDMEKMNIEKNKKESLDILSDLNLMFKYLDSQDGKYLCFLKTTLVDDKNKKIIDGFTGIDNLVLAEILDVFFAFTNYIERSIKKDKCKCGKCAEAAEKLKIVLNKLESE